MGKKILAFISIIVVMAILFTGCFAANNEGGDKQSKKTKQTDGEKILKMNSSTEPGSLHPALAQGTHESIILDHVFEGLAKRTPEGKIVPAMAKEWKPSPDGLTYTFTLRDGIKWSNGDPITAQDFEYAWKHALNPNTASDYAYQLYYLEGGEAYNTSKETDAAKLKALEDKVGVKALDEKTLEVKLAQPTPYFIELTAFFTYYPINKKVQEANANWANEGETHVSNGPFKIVEWNHKQSIKLQRNENYYNKDKVKLDGIDFVMIEDRNTAWQMYRSGELDIEYDLPPEVVASLSAKKDKELTIGDDLAVYFYRFNTTKKPFNNLKVRKALAMAIERQVICENVAQGGQRPAFGVVPPGIPDGKGDYQKNAGNYFKEDIKQAKKLLQEGLKEEGMNRLSFTILYNTSESHKKIAEAIQEMWRKNLGVEVTLENTEFQVKIDREHALDYEVSRSGWIGDYVDPMTFLDMWESKSTQNDTGWKNAEFDKLIGLAKTTLDNNKRMQYMKGAEKIFIDDMAIMPIYFYTRPYVQKPYVKGTYKPVNREIQVEFADIDK